MSLRHDDDEMSMDEILASIRRHVTNVEPKAFQDQRTEKNQEKPVINFSANSSYGVHLSEESRIEKDSPDEEEEIYELEDEPVKETSLKAQNATVIQAPAYNEKEASTIAHFRQSAERKKDERVNPGPAIDSTKIPPAQEETRLPDAVETDEKPNDLLSAQSFGAVIGSLSKLTAVQKQQKQEASEYSKAIENLVAQLLKGILREWADEHLPSLVEKVVRDEIKALVSKVSV